jgi:ABC-type nitrate/sulfonate/bicarbonate transport system permease component
MKTKLIGDKKLEQETRTVRWFYHSIPFIMLFLFWELLARVIHNPHILPPFSAVAVRAFSPSLAYHLGSTLAFSLLGLLIISLVGLPLGMLMNRFKKAEWALNPFFWFLLFASGFVTTRIVPIIAPMLIMLFGLSQLTALALSIVIPILVVALISGYGERLTAVRVGFLLCFSFRIGVEAMLGITTMGGIGHILLNYAYFHNTEMIYAIMLLMGFTGLFVDRVLKYVGNVVIGKEEIKEKGVNEK